MFYNRDAGHEGFWRVGMLRFSVVWWLRRLANSAPKNGSCGGSAAQDGARAIWKPKPLKHQVLGIGRRKDFETLQNMSRWKGSNFWIPERLLCGILRVSFRVAVKGIRMPRLNFRAAGAVHFEASTSKSLERTIILRPGVWPTCHF